MSDADDVLRAVLDDCLEAVCHEPAGDLCAGPGGVLMRGTRGFADVIAERASGHAEATGHRTSFRSWADAS